MAESGPIDTITEKDQKVKEAQASLLADIKASLVAQTESLGGSLGRDTINVRRHLLEMKKMHKDQLSNMEALNTSMGIRVKKDEKEEESKSVKAANTAEQQDDMRQIFIDIRDSIAGQPDAIAKASSAKSGPGMAAGFKDIMGGVGKGFKGIGIGIGAAGLGAAAVIGAGAYLLNVLDDIDSEAIKDNVANLLSISDVVEAKGDSFIGEGGKFFLVMTGLGVGLGIFAAGSGIAAGVSAFTKGSDWPEVIKDNVETLLSINELPGLLGDGLALAAVLGSLGVGLAVFALGKGFAGVAEVGTAGLEYFTKGGSWAQDIKNEVETLLSITDGKNWDAMGDAAGFAVVMTGLAAGLVAFAIGKGGSGVADALTLFQGDNFAEDIKSEVETLLSITQIEGIGWDTARFGAVMLGLGTGLLAFGAGKGAAGIGDITNTFAGDNFAEGIKTEVATLLTIGDLPGATLQKTSESMGILVALGAGLTAFGAGSFIAGLGQAGAAVLNFFSGGESPLHQALRLGDNADKINKGVDSLSNFKNILDDFSDISDVTFDMDTEQLAEDLLKASKTFEVALTGGTDDGGLFGRSIKLKGLLNIEGIDEGITQINKIKEALLQLPQSSGIEINATSLADQIAERLLGVGSGGTTINQVDYSNNSVNPVSAISIVGGSNGLTNDALN
jgi:hypothetical protein